MVVSDVNKVNDSITQNRIIIKQYIDARIIELNITENTQKVTYETLDRFSRNLNKNFKDVTRQDIISYLNKLRKSEIDDPNHKWKGTYNHTLMLISAFYKWFHYPKIEHRQRPTPDILLNIKQVKRKEISTYKPSDMWTQDDDLSFLKYCSSKRDRCYHAMSRDLSCRPSELLNLKIKDVVFKIVEERQYAEVVLNGKTGTRQLVLINSIPYVKDWLDSHPERNKPNAWLICHGKLYTRRLTRAGLYAVYKRYRTKIFPSLLKDPLLDSSEKAKIADLLKKPWNPYIGRHSGLTEKARILKDHTLLKQHGGWTATSNMHEKYVHYFNNESSESLLEAYGIKNRNKQETDKLKPRICPNCGETNKIDSRFCSNVRCRMVLTIEEYMTVTEENRQSQSKIEKLEIRLDENTAVLKKAMIETNNLANWCFAEANKSFARADSIYEVLESKFGITRTRPRPNITYNEEYYKERGRLDKIIKEVEV